MKFQKGQVANPHGRPRGSRNKATLAAESLFDGEAETLIRKAIEMAKAGDGPALRMCLIGFCHRVRIVPSALRCRR